MDFVELQVTCKPDFNDILIAEVAELGFDSMIETEEGFNAYIKKDEFQESSLSQILGKYSATTSFSWETEIIEKKNWNEEWEKNFDPVIINEQCVIRASFHEPFPQVPYEIIINPKMSFGTGHHETTSLMIGHQLGVDHVDKQVLDCGCGTGVLSILASKMKAHSVTGFDIDEWAIENSIENAQLNRCENVSFFRGTIRDMKGPGKFDIVLANINKNILLDEISQYSGHLKSGGQLILSGYYSRDLKEISDRAKAKDLQFSRSETINDWVGAVFIKK